MQRSPHLMPKPSRLLLLALAALAMLFGLAGNALAVTALSANIGATANCISNANLELSWTGAGNHAESGTVTDAAGNTIGTFGPDNSANDNWNGPYTNPIATAQPAGRLIGSYAWVGSNPPTEATAVEFLVVYNCSTRAVTYRCFGPYGRCPKTAAAVTMLPGSAEPIPATSKEMLAAMMLLLALLGGALARQRTGQRITPRRGS